MNLVLQSLKTEHGTPSRCHRKSVITMELRETWDLPLGVAGLAVYEKEKQVSVVVL